ncbi:hypothetical protein AAHA92_24504 [Salvia divinorum]
MFSPSFRKKAASEDEKISCSEDDKEFSPFKQTEITKNSTILKKWGLNNLGTDFMDDDYALMQAIALSLHDTETSCSRVTNPAPSANDNRRKSAYPGQFRKEGRKTESGKWSFTLGDVQRLAATHDFTWSDILL